MPITSADVARARESLLACDDTMREVLLADADLLARPALDAWAEDKDDTRSQTARTTLRRMKEFHAALVAEYETLTRAAIELCIKPRAGVGDVVADRDLMSLVDFDDMEMATVIERTAARIRNACDDVYSRMAARLGQLLAPIDPPPAELPVRPLLLCQAVAAALKSTGVSTAHAGPLVDKMAPQLQARLLAAYRALDALLIAQGLTGKRVLARRRRTEDSPADAAAKAAEANSDSDDSADAAESADSAEQEVSDAGHDAFDSDDGNLESGAETADVDEASAGWHMAPARGGNAEKNRKRADTSEGIAGIKGLLLRVKRLADYKSLPALTPAVDRPALVDALTQLHQQLAQTPVSADTAAAHTRAAREQLIAVAAPRDRMTIAALGGVFDQLAAAEAGAAAGGLTRLQFPMLWQALTEPGFFDNADHALRRLVDSLVSLPATVVEAAVREVLTAADTDPFVFDRAADHARQSAAGQAGDPAWQAKIEAVERRVRQFQRNEAVARAVAVEVAGTIEDVNLPAALREFIVHVWSRVMTMAALKKDEAGLSYETASSALSELVATVRPPIDALGQAQHAARVAKLAESLRRGLDWVGWAETRRAPFLAALAKAQATAKNTAPDGADADVHTPSVMDLKRRVARLNMVAIATRADQVPAALPPALVQRLLLADGVSAVVPALEHAPAAPPSAPNDPQVDAFIQGLRPPLPCLVFLPGSGGGGGEWLRANVSYHGAGDATRRLLVLTAPGVELRHVVFTLDVARAWVRAGALRPDPRGSAFDVAVERINATLDEQWAALSSRP